VTGSFLHANVAVILAITALGILLGHVWPHIGAAIRHAWEKTRT
jgi:hypothetical protein